jgi:transposase
MAVLIMTSNCVEVIGGVDTHGRTHHGAVIDSVGQVLGDQEFEATAAGYRCLLTWIASFGSVRAVGVEGTGTYGAGLARYLSANQVRVIEVDRPDRKTRRRHGKSDPIDAIAAARAVLAGTATATPKTRTGPVEALRALRVARRGAVKARVAALNQLHGLIASAPEGLRGPLIGLTRTALVKRCANFRINNNHLDAPVQATKAALRAIAHRIQHLDDEIAIADHMIGPTIADIAPTTLALPGVGPQVASQLVITAGDNPERLRSDAALAHLCGAAPIPASSGRTNRHRLNRGGDRHANNAPHTIVLTRMRHHEPTRRYVQRRTTDGLTTKDIIRCLKRFVVREIYATLIQDLNAPHPR